MSAGDKKWILDFGPPNDSIEVPEIIFDPHPLKSLPASILQLPLFIDSVTWLPLTVENAYIRLTDPEYEKQAGYMLFFNNISISYAIRLNELLQDPTSQTVIHASFSLQIVLGLLTKAPTNGAIEKRALEMFDEYLSCISRLQSPSATDIAIDMLRRLSLPLEKVNELPIDFRLSWQKQLLGSNSRNTLLYHPIASIASEYLSLNIKVALAATEDAKLSDPTVQKLAAAIPNDSSKIRDFLPAIALLGAHSETPFISGDLSTYYVLELSQNSSIEARKEALKVVDSNEFISSSVALLFAPSPDQPDSSIQSLQFWLDVHSDYSTMEAILDEITILIKNSGSALSSTSVGAKVLPHFKNRMSRTDQWHYIRNWLAKFAEISDLDLILTKLASLDEIKPHVNGLEVGLSIVHYITPTKLETPLEQDQNPENSSNEFQIDAHAYHELMTTLLQRMDIPDYFFYLGETKDYDKDNFKFNEMRVKTFQHLIGHYWHLMDSLLADMPKMSSLIQDNPIVLMPAGVTAPTEVPPWLDSFLVLMAVHAMPSDFATKETYLDVKQSIQTILQCESVKSLKKSPFALRIRQCIQLTKSRQKELLDDASKFSIMTWLCRQVPLHELSPNTDTYDGVVVNAVVNVINEVLGDHRPRIKILAIHLVLAICNQKSMPSSGRPPASILLPRATFDAIIRSLNFREVPLVEMALKACMALIKSRIENETQVAWAQSLMHTISYEMDYIQKKELLVIYLELLKGGILAILGIQIFLFSHPLMVRLVSLLDVGDFQMTRLALENIAQLMQLAWPRIHLEEELIFGSLGSVWIDQVLILPTDAPSTHPEHLQSNITIIKDLIRHCLLILFQIVEPTKALQMVAQVAPLTELKPFHDLIMEMLEAKVKPT